jgi:hypothetical protein
VIVTFECVLVIGLVALKEGGLHVFDDVVMHHLVAAAIVQIDATDAVVTAVFGADEIVDIVVMDLHALDLAERVNASSVIMQSHDPVDQVVANVMVPGR